jgi:hypothetical protein
LAANEWHVHYQEMSTDKSCLLHFADWQKHTLCNERQYTHTRWGDKHALQWSTDYKALLLNFQTHSVYTDDGSRDRRKGSHSADGRLAIDQIYSVNASNYCIR